MGGRTRAALAAALTTCALATGAAPAAAAPTGPVSEVATGLSTPWEVLALPDGRVLVTERPGRIRVVEGPGTGTVLLDGGPQTAKFLGLVAHPSYATNRFLYLYQSYRVDGGGTRNRVVRLVDEGARLAVQRVVFDGIDSDGNHDGGRMAFGPDGRLYVTTGDVHQPTRPQDRQSLNGKVLRLVADGTDADGTAPADNPFVAEGGTARFVWSYGHRHPQGLAFDADGRLWESEHGPSGEGYGPTYEGGDGKSKRDELNLITKGGNYGWPLVSGPLTREGTIAPAAYAEDAEPSAWAPGGLVVGAPGHLYMPQLAGAEVREFVVADGRVTSETTHLTSYGRLRTAATDRTGALLFTGDGDGAVLRRVALSPAAPWPSVAQQLARPVGAPTPSPAPSAPSTPGSGPSATPDAAAAAALRRAIDALDERAGLRRLRGRSGVGTRVTLPAGRLTVRLTARGRTIATGSARTTKARRATVRLRLTARGKALTRRRTRLTTVLRGTFAGTDGGRATATRRVVLRR